MSQLYLLVYEGNLFLPWIGSLRKNKMIGEQFFHFSIIEPKLKERKRAEDGRDVTMFEGP